MNFLNIGPGEITLVLILAVLILGPQKMAELGRLLGKVVSQLRRSSDAFIGEIQSEIQAIDQETQQTLAETQASLTHTDQHINKSNDGNQG